MPGRFVQLYPRQQEQLWVFCLQLWNQVRLLELELSESRVTDSSPAAPASLGNASAEVRMLKKPKV
jgi:hypothetical protein